MEPIAFSFRGIYFDTQNNPYTISGNALAIPSNHSVNKTGKDLLMVTYWAHEFIQGVDRGAARVFLTYDGTFWQSNGIKNGILLPINSVFLDWLKDLVVKKYSEEKNNPAELSPYSPGESK